MRLGAAPRVGAAGAARRSPRRATGPPARVALLLARELFLAGRPADDLATAPPAGRRRRMGAGRQPADAARRPARRRRRGRSTASSEPGDLWRAEVALVAARRAGRASGLAHAPLMGEPDGHRQRRAARRRRAGARLRRSESAARGGAPDADRGRSMTLPDHRFPAPMSRVALIAPEQRGCARCWSPSPTSGVGAARRPAAGAAGRGGRGAAPPGARAPARPRSAARRASPRRRRRRRAGARRAARPARPARSSSARRAEAAVRRGPLRRAAWHGCPASELPALTRAARGGRGSRRRAAGARAGRAADAAAAARGWRAAFRPLVDTYGAARYADLDPTPFAAVSFVLMFGMMFGDVGHGLMLAALGLLLRRVARAAPARAPPAVAVPVRRRPGRGRVRPALRRGVRPDGHRADAVAGAARRPRAAARGRGRRSARCCSP